MRHLIACILSCAATLAAAEPPLAVVCGNTVVHDLVTAIGGPEVAASGLLAPGVDPHHYQPVPEDAKRLAQAQLVVINGLGFEGWFEKLAAESGYVRTVVQASAGIAVLQMAEPCAGHGHDHAHHHHGEVPDPHAFNSIRQGVRYAENIRDALVQARPAAADGIKARAGEVIERLRAADAWATAELAALPKARRRIVTNHDALGYFARDYGFAVLAPNTALQESQPTAKDIAAIVGFIRAQGVRGVFLEYGENAKVVEQIAAEAGVRVGGELYLDGVGPAGTPAADYIGAFKANVTTILTALR